MSKQKPVNVWISLGLALLASASSCAPKAQDEEFAGISCGAPDQHQSYMNPMDSTQVQTISIDSRFSSVQIAKIERAVETWNAHGRRTLKRNLFKVQTFALSTSSVPTSGTDCGFPGTPSGFSVVKITDATTWSELGFQKSNPGVTLRCSSGKDFTAKQTILLNPSNLDSAQNAFENVILHELGHAIGLDHSCDSANRGNPAFKGCDSVSGSSDPYAEAVMYYLVNSGHPKEELASNDEERASCALNYRP